MASGLRKAVGGIVKRFEHDGAMKNIYPCFAVTVIVIDIFRGYDIIRIENCCAMDGRWGAWVEGGF
jgi:hypothetical protein